MNLRSFLPIAALAVACSGAPQRPAPGAPAAATTPADFYPLSVGDERIYRDVSPALAAGQQGATRTVRVLERTKDGYFRDTDRGELRADLDCVHDRSRRLL